jgi:nucleotide-binding universal stress UspA family protein
MYRSILVYVDREGSRKRIELALALAQVHHASLIGLAAGLPRVPVEFYANGFAGIPTSMHFASLEREELEAEFQRAAAVFAEVTENSEIKTEWRSELDFPASALSKAADAADLIVIGCGSDSTFGEYRVATAGDLIMRAGRPVLAVPTTVGALIGRNVLIAWKSTGEARRAVSDAMPLIRRADNVHIVHINEGNNGESHGAEDLKALLARHDVFAHVESLGRGDGPIEELLLKSTRRHGADLIVAGAYGHTRLREWILGGMTRGLLARSSVACLMSH